MKKFDLPTCGEQKRLEQAIVSIDKDKNIPDHVQFCKHFDPLRTVNSHQSNPLFKSTAFIPLTYPFLLNSIP